MTVALPIPIESRVIMRAWFWLVVSALGFGMMSAAYITRVKPDPQALWAHGCIAIGPEPAAGGPLVPGTMLRDPVRLRLLPAIDRTEAILKAMEQATPGKGFNLQAQLRPKLIVLRFKEAGIDETSLQSGRLPAVGKDEVLAGALATQIRQVVTGDRSLEIVGRLKPDLALFADSYLIPASDASNELFPLDDPAVHQAALIHLQPDQFYLRGIQAQLEKALPSATYTKVMTQDRLDPTSFYRYVAGLAIMLLGGSGALIGLYRWAAEQFRRRGLADDDVSLDRWDEPGASKSRPNWLAAPLVELQMRPRLVWGVHLAYFGLVILGSVLIHELPDLQTAFMSTVRDALTAKSGVLAAAGQAYGSGSIPRAALVTFVVNFFLGSLICITLPSMIVPGSGILIATLRSVFWGLILAPTLVMLAFTMLPHSGTMLLEGEGYILSTFFGLLIPIHIFQSSLGGNPLSRFGRVLLLNIQSLSLVALVLAVAACYEATEVILMNR